MALRLVIGLAVVGLGCKGERGAALDAGEAVRSPTAVAAKPVVPTPGDDVAHGRYLATIGACLECHTPRLSNDPERLDEAKLMSGGTPFGGPWGVVHTANVSAVAAAYQPAHLEAAIRGQLSFKFQMPTDLYAAYAADDMRDLVAFLRSLSPVDVPAPTNQLADGYRPPLPLTPRTVRETAPTGVTVERGEYLVHVAICKDCHSPRAADGVSYDEERRMSGGGIGIKVSNAWLVPPNLTNDPETGLGRWSDDEIIAAFRTGKRKDGRRLHPVMPARVAYAEMTDDDAKAIVAYLRALPPIRAKRPPNGPYENPGDIACCFEPPAPEATP
ncbi:MAG: cytochrome c [Myxococcaceae bacterium]|nr:cytochrome c [Myxococcaceae bacterium]